MENTKYRIGYLDDDDGTIISFNRIFKSDFDIVFFDDKKSVSTLDLLVEQINSTKIDALAVDYKLADKGDFCYNGDDVVRKLQQCKLHFPVFLLTSYADDAIDDSDVAFLVYDKDNVKDNGTSQILIRKIKSSIRSYKRLISNKEKRLEALEKKQTSIEGLSKDEEQELINLHFEMYHVDPTANPISPEMLQTSSIRELHELVDKTNEILKSIKERN